VDARHWLSQAERADAAIYAAVARTDNPRLDRAMYLVSGAANYSRLWIAAAGLLAAAGARNGRRAAVDGLASIAVTATAAVALRALAALVAYSRVHTGVHYPGDVAFGSLLGISVARLTTRALERGRF
jgi:hypothetical protein